MGTAPAPTIEIGDMHRFRVAFPRRYWYPAAQSAELARQPVGITLMDTPLVLFRDATGHPRALLDRCAHRNLALSLGRVHADGCIECAYHGWRFDGSGSCSVVPGLLADPASSARSVMAYAVTEQDGFVWVWGEPGATPSGLPLALPSFTGPGCGQVELSCDLDCTLHAAVENALDVPHTAFLHRGLFRGGSAEEITAERRQVAGGVEVRYLGEPVRFGPLKKAGPGLTFDHRDRFLLPSTAQIEYRVEGFFRLTNTIIHLPLGPFRTRAWFVVRYWSRLPGAIVRPIVAAQGRRILAQDAGVLAHQTENVRRFGQIHYSSTDLDLLGNAIWRLLLEGERASTAGDGGAGDVEVRNGGAGDGGAGTVTFRA